MSEGPGAGDLEYGKPLDRIDFRAPTLSFPSPNRLTPETEANDKRFE